MNAGYTNPNDEGVERLSLRDAANLLKISESGVRARFKKGQIEGERDNSGKIWVFVTASMKDAVQVVQGQENEGSAAAHRELLRTLQQQIIGLKAERDHYRSQAKEEVRLIAEKARLEAEIRAAIKHREEMAKAAEAQIADLRAQLTAAESERRQLFSAVLEQALQRKEEAANHGKGFSIFGFQISRKAGRP